MRKRKLFRTRPQWLQRNCSRRGRVSRRMGKAIMPGAETVKEQWKATEGLQAGVGGDGRNQSDLQHGEWIGRDRVGTGPCWETMVFIQERDDGDLDWNVGCEDRR